MRTSRSVAVGVFLTFVAALGLTGAVSAIPPGSGGWRAYTESNDTTCAVEVGGKLWVGTNQVGLARYDVLTRDLEAKYHCAVDALTAPENIVPVSYTHLTLPTN